MVTKDLGMVTAYAYAVAGGYTGTEAQFEQLMADLAIVVDDFDNFSVTVTTLPAGSSATASYSDGVLSLGIPKGDKGDKGDTGEKGDKGDTGEVSEAELTETLEAYAKKDGTVANAKQLISTVSIEDSVPYKFRTSGGSVDIGDRETDTIVGGTIAWNQLQAINAPYSGTETINGVTFTRNGDGTFTVSGTATAIASKSVNRFTFLAKHVYIVKGCPPGGGDGTYKFFSTADVNGRVVKYNADDTQYIRIGIGADFTANNLIFKPQIFDLTHMFGSVIADYIYGLQTATAGAGAAYFHKLFPKPFYEYNSGELLSISGLQSHDMVGFNAWDEEWEVGAYNGNTGAKASSSNQIRCKNKIHVLPNTTYYFHSGRSYGTFQWYGYDIDEKYIGTISTSNSKFTTASNCHYVTWNGGTNSPTSYNNDICINLSWDGERDGEYEPYVKHTYPLDSSLTLRGMPKLDASNNLYYDGDTYESDGTVTRKYAEVTLNNVGSSYVTTPSASGLFRISTSLLPGVKFMGNVISTRWSCVKSGLTTSMPDKSIYVNNSSTNILIYIVDSDFIGKTAAETASMLSGTKLVYELRTPTTESAEPYTNPQIVDDFGTEEYVTNSIVPVGHFTKYMNNLRAKLEMTPESPRGDGDYIVRQASGENSYVALASTTTIQSIIARLEALENA